MELKRRWLQVGAVAFVLVGTLAMGSGIGWGADAGSPKLASWARQNWERQMRIYGERHCTTLAQVSGDQALAATYYDTIRVMYQIADYTGDAVWKSCALRARSVYRDAYVLRNKGGVPGYWNFATGLRMDYQRTGDHASKNAVISLAQNAAYASDVTPIDVLTSAALSREAAYAIVSYIDEEKVARSPRARRRLMVGQAYGHMDQWFTQFVWKNPDGTVNQQFSPFMVGLTAHALIRDWEQTGDSRLIPALTRAAEWLWANAWMPKERAMWYEAAQPTLAAPDLNLLIAPMYAFLYRQTGDSKYRDEGDALFSGGVDLAWLDGAKQFNQNYWWSFDYVKWRSALRPSDTTSVPR